MPALSNGLPGLPREEGGREELRSGLVWDAALVPESRILGLALPNWFRDLGVSLTPPRATLSSSVKQGCYSRLEIQLAVEFK